MEDIRVTQGASDQDFNDIVFSIKGAVSIIDSADGEIRSDRDWRKLSMGDDILNYAEKSFDQILQGGTGSQTLTGGVGDDLLEGFRGRDLLIGGLGDDILTGGNGEDTFVLSANTGTDIITDFKAGYDVLGISEGLSYSDLSFEGNNILHGGTNEVIARLSGFDTTSLSAANFVEM
ncbi:MAG: hypothetical protein AAGC93_13645 [Cyanobacteria bacterium P01_F01_bin.53]